MSKFLSFTEASQKSTEEVLKSLETTKDGLGSVQVQKRQAEWGKNKIENKGHQVWTIFARQFKSSFIYLLIAAIGISAFLGETVDAIMISLFVVINVGLGFYQEYKSENSLKLLQQFLKHTVHVCRGGKKELIDSSELVTGDIVILQAGDKIPADIRIIEETSVVIDESILTGESQAVEKNSKVMKMAPKNYYEASNIGFSGSLVQSGELVGVVIGVGRDTVFGNLSKLTVETKRLSAFEESLNRFSIFIIKLISATLILMVLANILMKGFGGLLEIVLFAIALTVSVIPEALPLVTTLSFSQGALHMAKKRVVVKRLSSIEDLGSIDVLCTDKTGTITQNVLTVKNIKAEDGDLCRLYAQAASSFWGEEDKEVNNAFDIALFESSDKELKDKMKKLEKISELPFDHERKRNSVIIKDEKGEIWLIVRGAPEILHDLIKIKKSLDDDYVKNEGLNGRRVLAIAYKKLAKPVVDYDLELEKDLTFSGYISFVDELKPDTVEAIKRAEKLNVQIKILTGDAPEVAGSVAQEVGLVKNKNEVITGEEFSALDSGEQFEAIKKYHVFARLNPEQKFAIIELLKKENTVGFLGEGFNDAPALKMAHVGLVVDTAADIAREAADVVLLDRSLITIITGIEEGRLIFANTVKYIKNTLTSNFGNFFAIAVISIFVDYLPMLPIQILLVNLLSDFPMIAIVTDGVDREELKRPRHYDVKEIALFAFIFGLISTVFDFVFFVIFSRFGPQTLQTLWFVESIATELVLIFSLRTKKPFWKAHRVGRPLLYLSSIALIVTVVLPFLPIAQKLFKFIRPEIWQISLVLGMVGLYFVSNEIVKRFYCKFMQTESMGNMKRVKS